jgi:hypothetical protein
VSLNKWLSGRGIIPPDGAEAGRNCFLYPPLSRAFKHGGKIIFRVTLDEKFNIVTEWAEPGKSLKPNKLKGAHNE